MLPCCSDRVFFCISVPTAFVFRVPNNFWFLVFGFVPILSLKSLVQGNSSSCAQAPERISLPSSADIVP